MSSGQSSLPPSDTPPTPGPGRLLVPVLIGTALAGLVAGLAGEALYPQFKPAKHLVQTMSGPVEQPTEEDLNWADAKNSAVACGVLGGLLGAALGLAGVVAHWKHPRRGRFAAPLVGLILGAGLGVAMSLAFLPFFLSRVPHGSDELMYPLLMHAGLFAPLGLAGGLAFGLGMGMGGARLVRAILGAVIGAFLGAVLYELAGGLFFPLAKSSDPISKAWTTRVLACLAVALVTGLMAALAILDAERARGRAPKDPSTSAT